MKKLTILFAMAALLAFAGNATAQEVYKINLAGASAQADFWEAAGASFLNIQLNCATISKTGAADNGIVRGEDCDFPGTYTAGNGNTVMIGYLAIASYAGCENAVDCQSLSMCDPSSASFSTDLANPGACPDNLDQPVHLGAADVPCECLSQSSSGYADGYCADWEDESVYSPNPDDPNDVNTKRCCDTEGELPGLIGNPSGWESFGPYDNALPARMQTFASVAVPFGFIVNDSVQAYQCTAPAVGQGDVAYDTLGNFCTPNASGESADCQGYADCDMDTGTCVSGLNAGNACSTPADCPAVALNQTSCDLRPVQSLSRIQLVQILSDTVTAWTDLGPWFDVVSGHADLPVDAAGPTPGSGWEPNAPSYYENNDTIVLCMRHAGSGTHATTENVILRDDANLKNVSDCTRIFHYRSSSDLTDDCVQRFPGAIGYVDADKLLGRDGGNTHFVKYQGVEANRFTVRNGDYPYFAEQQTFYDEACVSADLQTLATDLNDFASQEANLNEANFGIKAKFWATQGELAVSKGTTCGGCGFLPAR